MLKGKFAKKRIFEHVLKGPQGQTISEPIKGTVTSSSRSNSSIKVVKTSFKTSFLCNSKAREVEKHDCLKPIDKEAKERCYPDIKRC